VLVGTAGPTSKGCRQFTQSLLVVLLAPCCRLRVLLRYMCVVMWGGRSFGLHTSKVRAKDRGHTYSLHRTHMGCLTWTGRAHVL
jgi:hypothetical protein